MALRFPLDRPVLFVFLGFFFPPFAVPRPDDFDRGVASSRRPFSFAGPAAGSSAGSAPVPRPIGEAAGEAETDLEAVADDVTKRFLRTLRTLRPPGLWDLDPGEDMLVSVRCGAWGCC